MIDHYLENAIEGIDTTPIRNWTVPLYIGRNFLYYMWYITYRPGSNLSKLVTVPRADILKYTGTGYTKDIEKLVATDLADYIKVIEHQGTPSYQIKTDDLNKIQTVFGHHYRVTDTKLPYLDISSHAYTQAFFYPGSDLRGIVHQAFRSIFNPDGQPRNVNITLGDRNSLYLEHPDQWQCLVVVHQHEQSLNIQEMDTLCGPINRLRGLYGKPEQVPVLLIAPPGNSFEAFRAPNQNPYTYHLTPLSSQRLFQKLETEVFNKGWKASELADVFPALFPFDAGENTALSELRAIERLVAALTEKKSTT